MKRRFVVRFSIFIVNPMRKKEKTCESQTLSPAQSYSTAARVLLGTWDVTCKVKQYLYALIAANLKKKLQKVNISSRKDNEIFHTFIWMLLFSYPDLGSGFWTVEIGPWDLPRSVVQGGLFSVVWCF